MLTCGVYLSVDGRFQRTRACGARWRDRWQVSAADAGPVDKRWRREDGRFEDIVLER